jgi:tRNA1Val (adenine37-N6)-methyltransferase
VSANLQKHPCPDCTFCQWCGDDRCALCLRKDGCGKRKLSVAEQIAFFDELNRKAPVVGDDGETVDILRDFDLKIIQPKNGYRFSLDPLILCEFAPSHVDSILDLGSGCGVIPLVMARLTDASLIAAVEVQPRMAGIAARNARDNALDKRVSVLEADVHDLARYYRANSFDLVMGNPPYRRAGTGKTSPEPGRDLARHESSATLADFLSVAKRMVKTSGSICFIYHPERLAELLSLAEGLKLSPARLQMVHGDLSLPARMFMVELYKGRRAALEILPPLLVRDSVYGVHQSAGRQTGR